MNFATTFLFEGFFLFISKSDFFRGVEGILWIIWNDFGGFLVKLIY